MNKIKTYFNAQAQRPFAHIMFDFVMIGSFVLCVYFGFIH